MPAEPAASSTRLALAMRYLLAGVLVLGTFYVVPFAAAWESLRTVRVPWYAAALLLLGASRWLGALRTWLLAKLHSLHLSVTELFGISCVSTLYGLALPGGISGGIVRWHRIGQPQANHSAAAALIVFERLVDYATLGLLGVAALAADARLESSGALAWAIGVSLVALAVLLAASLSRIPVHAAALLAHPAPRASGLIERLRTAAESALHALGQHRNARALVWTTVLSVAVHLIGTAGTYCIARSIDLDLDYVSVIWIRACTLVLITLPTTPGALGVRELGTIALLQLLAHPPAVAVAFSLLQFVCLVLFAGLGGLFEAQRYLLRSASPARATAESSPAAGREVSECDRDAGQAVALIVLNHQRRELLLECLRAAAATRHTPCRAVVVDNGSTDGSADAAERAFPEAVVLRSPSNRGAAGGRNLGVGWVLRNLGAPFVMFIDNDTLLEPDTVGEMVRRATGDPRIGLVAPKAFRRKGNRRLLSAGGLHFNRYTGVLSDVACDELDDGRFDAPRDIQSAPGFAFLVRREVFARIGLFDEHFNPYGWEDADFSLRAADAGYRLAYAPRAVVYHLGGRAGRGPIAEYEYHKARSMFYFVRKHTSTVQWLCFLLLLPPRAIKRIAAELLGGRLGIVRMWLSSLRALRQGNRG
jgi:uncharacterized protein (TIRG00374 family)